MDPLVRKMAEFILEGARSADELHAAIDDAVQVIEDNPQAQYASQLTRDESSEFTQVHIVLVTGDELLVDVEEEPTDALKSVDSRICDGTEIGVRRVGSRIEWLTIVPPATVKFLAVRP